MLKTSLLIVGSALLCSLAVAAPSYKGNTTVSIYPDSLEGWDGTLPRCSDRNLKACWEKGPHYVETRTWFPVVSFGAGAVFTNKIGQSQDFQIIDPVTDEFFYYTAKKPDQTGALFELFLGAEWMLNPCWNLQAGLDLDQVYTQYSASGTFIQGADTQSADQFNYSYSAITRQAMAETKLLYNYRRVFHPYGLLALGAAFNTAYDYQTSVPPFLTFTRLFADNTTTSLTYALGLGLDIDINKDLRLGVGYRFTDLGKTSFGSTSINGMSVSGTLTQNHLYSNVFMAQLTLLF